MDKIPTVEEDVTISKLENQTKTQKSFFGSFKICNRRKQRQYECDY